MAMLYVSNRCKLFTFQYLLTQIQCQIDFIFRYLEATAILSFFFFTFFQYFLHICTNVDLFFTFVPLLVFILNMFQIVVGRLLSNYKFKSNVKLAQSITI
jgi:hypothetical protein